MAFARPEWRHHRAPYATFVTSRSRRWPLAAFAGAVTLVATVASLAARPRAERPAVATGFLQNTDPTGARLALLAYAPLGSEVERVHHGITAGGGVCRTRDEGDTARSVCLAPPVVRGGALTAQRIELLAVSERLRAVEVCPARLRLVDAGDALDAPDAPDAPASCAAPWTAVTCAVTAAVDVSGCDALIGVSPRTTARIWDRAGDGTLVLRVNGRQWSAQP
jgi:hypothetical protein